MFAKAFEKIAGFTLKTIVGAIKKREDALAKSLKSATKGKKREMMKYLPKTRWMQQQVDSPISKEIIDAAMDSSVHPDTKVTGLWRDRYVRERLLKRKLEHAGVLQQRTRNPLQVIKDEVATRARRKKHYAKAWRGVSEEMSAKIKKVKATKAKSKKK